MGANNTRYIPSKEFQEALIDKDTGLALADGKVYAYKDNARTVRKPLYAKVEGAPDNTYEELPVDTNGAIILSNIGTFNYCGNDIIPYFYPYDENGNIELYYLKVDSSDDVEQFTRFAVPNLAEDVQPDEEIEEINYIPNGQFIVHNDVPLIDDTKDQGEIISDVVEVAPGNWTFERSSGSLAKDIILFDRFGSATSNPTGNPRYAIRLKCENPDAGTTFKGLRCKFRDVNKFTSPAGQLYNFSFSAKTNLGGEAIITVKVVKNYGTGGDAEETIINENKTITNSYTTYSTQIDFGNNEGKVIGDNDDDYVMLEISFSTSILFDNSFTDFVLIANPDIPINYPLRTVNQDIYKSLSGSTPVPSYSGYDLYLPIISTPTGFAYDDSQIGKVYYSALDDNHLRVGELFCNGDTYKPELYSNDGIPYRRLFNKLWNPNVLITTYGSGKEFVNVFPFSFVYPMDENKIIVYENSFGNTTLVADGTVATGFTFVSVQAGVDYQKAYIFTVQTVAGSSITEGAYFRFYTPSQFPVPPNPSGKKYLVWYSKLTTSTAPTETADGKIKVLYSDSDTDKEIAKKTLIAINQFQYAIPDLRGQFLRVNDLMSLTSNTDVGYKDLDARNSVVGIFAIHTAGTGYAAGDIVEIGPAFVSSAGVSAKLYIKTVGGSGDATEVILILNGFDYTLPSGRQDNIPTTAISPSTGTNLKVNIKIGETRAAGLLMDEVPITGAFSGYNAATQQKQDVAATLAMYDGGAAPPGENKYISGGASAFGPIHSTSPHPYLAAPDSVTGTRSFKVATSSATLSVNTETGNGTETRPTNIYVYAVIKY